MIKPNKYCKLSYRESLKKNKVVKVLPSVSFFFWGGGNHFRLAYEYKWYSNVPLSLF